jgi:hypothetical protein
MEEILTSGLTNDQFEKVYNIYINFMLIIYIYFNNIKFIF